VAMNVLLFVLIPYITEWMGVTGTTAEMMIEYTRIRSFEMVFVFAFFAFQASRIASGDTVTPFILNLIMIVSNITMNWFFMGYLKLGVAGAAYGTLLSHMIIFPIFIRLLFKTRSNHISISITDIQIDKDEIKRIFKLAWPAAISQAITSLGFILITAIIYSYGEITQNAFVVGNRINSLILMPAMGIGGITATFVGQNIGAGNTKRARDSVKAALITSIAISLIGAAIVYPYSTPLVTIFLKKSPEAIPLSVEYMFFLLAGLPLMSIFQVFMGAYQGSGETKFSLVLSVFRLWGMRIPLIYLFTRIMGLPASSIWYAMILSNFASAYVGIILYSKCKFTPKVKIEKEIDEELCLT